MCNFDQFSSTRTQLKPPHMAEKLLLLVHIIIQNDNFFFDILAVWSCLDKRWSQVELTSSGYQKTCLFWSDPILHSVSMQIMYTGTKNLLRFGMKSKQKQSKSKKVHFFSSVYLSVFGSLIPAMSYPNVRIWICVAIYT